MNKELKINTISISLSLIITLVIITLFLFTLSKNPFEIYSVMLGEVFGSFYGFGQMLFKATPLIIIGCGLAICFHASLFNIGAEGQLNAGSFVTAIVLVALSDLPFILAFIISVACGFLVSGLFGLIPAIIKIKKGVNEVITTIMMNFIILYLVNYFLMNFFTVPATQRTIKIPESFMLPQASDLISAFQGSALNITFIFAILLALIIYFIIYKTRFGYNIRAVGFNEIASAYIGLKPARITLLSFFIGAGVISLAGINFVMGYKGYYEFGYTNNIGFTAIAVALLARNHPIGIIFSALLFAFLDFGGLAVNQIIPKEVILVIEALVILSIISVNKLTENYFNKT
ncbi:MAG TPA: ABC transporter permease [Ignavibacteria bacterium]|nr:ABC transporter permease [Ignavibacteria bacterium]